MLCAEYATTLFFRDRLSTSRDHVPKITPVLYFITTYASKVEGRKNLETETEKKLCNYDFFLALSCVHALTTRGQDKIDVNVREEMSLRRKNVFLLSICMCCLTACV